MNKPKITLLIDLASLRITCEGFKKLMEKIETQFDVVGCKFYSYVAKRNRDFNEYIAAKGYEAVTPIASKRRNKLDTRQVIDGTLIGINSKVDAVAIASGEGDILPIVSYLKNLGKDVYEINVEEGRYSEVFTGFISVAVSWLREGYAAPTTKPVVKKAPKPVAQPAAAVKPQESKYAAEVKKVFSASDILSRYKK